MVVSLFRIAAMREPFVNEPRQRARRVLDPPRNGNPRRVWRRNKSPDMMCFTQCVNEYALTVATKRM